MLLVPTCYGLLMTLTIRGCMEEGGPQGILALLAPDWSHITQPRAWMEAAKFVFISMQLGWYILSWAPLSFLQGYIFFLKKALLGGIQKPRGHNSTLF